MAVSWYTIVLNDPDSGDVLFKGYFRLDVSRSVVLNIYDALIPYNGLQHYASIIAINSSTDNIFNSINKKFSSMGIAIHSANINNYYNKPSGDFILYSDSLISEPTYYIKWIDATINQVSATITPVFNMLVSVYDISLYQKNNNVQLFDGYLKVDDFTGMVIGLYDKTIPSGSFYTNVILPNNNLNYPTADSLYNISSNTFSNNGFNFYSNYLENLYLLGTNYYNIYSTPGMTPSYFLRTSNGTNIELTATISKIIDPTLWYSFVLYPQEGSPPMFDGYMKVDYSINYITGFYDKSLHSGNFYTDVTLSMVDDVFIGADNTFYPYTNTISTLGINIYSTAIKNIFPSFPTNHFNFYATYYPAVFWLFDNSSGLDQLIYTTITLIDDPTISTTSLQLQEDSLCINQPIIIQTNDVGYVCGCCSTTMDASGNLVENEPKMVNGSYKLLYERQMIRVENLVGLTDKVRLLKYKGQVKYIVYEQL